MSFLGLFFFLFLAWVLSSNRSKINWKLVVFGLILQFVFALLVFQSRSLTFPDAEGVDRYPNGVLFSGIDFTFSQIEKYVEAGSGFLLFAYPRPGEETGFPPRFHLLRTFVFGVLPTVIFFSSLMAVLYHLGVMQRVVKAMAWVMQKTLGTSGGESLAAAANVFIGHTEAPLIVRPYLNDMTKSELNALMVGGFATITGGLMAVYVSMGVNAGHLLTASVISAPAALLIAKMLIPETEASKTMGDVTLEFEKNSVNVIEAAAAGASEGMKLAINIAAMLLAFLALIAMIDAILGGVGEIVESMIKFVYPDFGYDLKWSLSSILAILFSPVAWMMGIEWKDCGVAGEMLGIKMTVNEFVAYSELSNYLPKIAADGQVAPSILPAEEQISERTQLILTYALAGFSNFGAIAIQIGGIGGLAPNRRSDLAKLGLKAMIGGTIACCMTACFAGILL